MTTRNVSEIEALPPNHYRIHVDRGPLPPIAKMQEHFEAGVSGLFEGRYEWKRHESRAGVNDVTDEEVVIYVHDFGGPIDPEDVITWGLTNGYVPADEKETYAVGIDPQTRDLQQQNWLVGLGSFALGIGRCHLVASLYNIVGRRILIVYGFDFWRRGGKVRYLFVRKPV